MSNSAKQTPCRGASTVVGFQEVRASKHTYAVAAASASWLDGAGLDGIAGDNAKVAASAASTTV
jgi:hypothetical protein